jgi:uncharacterized membrane protein
MGKPPKNHKPAWPSPSRSLPEQHLNPTLVNPLGAGQIEITHTQVQHHGPLPHSSEIRAYDQAYKGAAKILFENFDEQSKHRRKMEELTIRAEAYERDRAIQLEAEEIRRGQYLAFGCVVLFVALASFAFYRNHSWAGSVFALCGIGGIVSTFVIGRNKREESAAVLQPRKHSPDTGSDKPDEITSLSDQSAP